MAQLYGQSSNYLLNSRLVNKYTALWIASWVFPIIIIGFSLFLYEGSTWVSLIKTFLPFVLLSCLLFHYANLFKIKAVKFKAGMIGEELALRELLRLPNEYMIFRGIHLPKYRWDIDFIVVGPTGVHVVEVKNIKGTIEFDGKELLCNSKLLEGKSVIKQVRNEYHKLHEYLKEKLNEEVFIVATIVFVRAHLAHDLNFDSIKDIKIINNHHLKDFFTIYASHNHKQPSENLKKELVRLTTVNV